ncbi:UxaA family hydrolase [Enterovibrio nigricans]|uniref:(2R)-sulfolactate sulfo-lyase subunit beta n=1 Tax=Enterovibrio nigricans DSM 22720 TaxID=1121868 RepID=A0A1T4VCL6_9GAMM|nr:UxaA family hydrolase [Enterovibrio nigricans]SKA62695.1 (2R)-sulfolactate sulfo-lyase subunit beta [Enterovibrio nigricans DSM 22720]
MSNYKFMGYRRENGRVGVRNHVIILPLDDLSNAACEAVANNIKGTLAIPHPYGCLQFGENLELHFRTLIGTGCNPNVAAVVVIGIEPEWTARVVEGIAESGKPVQGFAIEQNGDINTIASASRVAKEYVQAASELTREECDVSELWISMKCGESDTTSGLAANPTVGNLCDKLSAQGATLCFGETSELTGAEQICATRAVSPEIGEKFLNTWQAYMDEVIEPHKTSDLSDSQPTKGNILGGLTTIEEKAFGNYQKIGKTTQFVDVLTPAERPAAGPGLYFMDTSSAAAECVTLQAAAGFAVHLFPTGQGNVIGNPIVPVIKITANPRTVRTMGEHIDVDVSGILARELNMDSAGDALIDMTLRTANGRYTAAESLGHREFVLTKLYRSA